ncbi:helicase-related protein [Dietzia maris]
MTRLFDNIERKLGSQLQETLKVSDRMDVAVGYFNLRGWSAFDEIVQSKVSAETQSPVVRVLIGMVMGGPQQEALDDLQAAVTGEEVQDADRSAMQERKTELLIHLREQLMRGISTRADRASLQSLRDLLAAGAVEIKVFTRRPLHGKTYICHREDLNNPITGFVGSSNLTSPGLLTNLELNVDVVDYHGAQELAKWFQARWADKFSRPVTAEILDLLDDSWARKEPRKPYEVFLKVCYDLSRDVRDGLAEYSVPDEISRQLLEYQGTAVKTLARRIVHRRGTMLGDVVGLGKTLTAIATALMLRDEHGYIPLVLCPKNLAEMWEEHLEAYDLHGRVVPYSMAHKVLPELRRYPFVIIDESHTLRSDTRRDYKAIRDYIDANDSKVLMLTATPYNIKFEDVANQLGLYLDDDDDLGIAPVNALAADPSLADRVDGKTTTLAAFRKSDDPEDWKRLMSEHLVRRTRSFIKDNYSLTDDEGRQYLQFSNGAKFSFPTRIPKPIDHSFGPDDPAALMASDVTLDTINSLLLPRYNLGAYINTHVALTAEEKDFVDNVTRARGQVAGFVRTNFFKRLSSCGHSFTLSLNRHIARNELFLHAIDNNRPLPAGTITESMFDGDADLEDDLATETGDAPARRYEHLVEVAPSGLTWVRPDLFTSALREDLAVDTDALRAQLDQFGNWSTATDSKLAALVTLIQETHSADKVLVFTEYKDTANYISDALKTAGIAGVGLATGDSEDPTALARRFAPRSNKLPGDEDGANVDNELRVLIATDVLSEGQNLQDAYIVVNYDLPWAIIKLIQRAGRVDRVGQQSDHVLLYSFFHESVEEVISLRNRISQRLSANAEAFGSDEQFFGSKSETNTIRDLYNGSLDDQDLSDDVDASSLAFEIWNKAVKNDPSLADRVSRLPDMISATRARRLTDTADGVLAYVRTDSGIDGFGLADSDGTMRLLTGHEVLKAFEASPEENGLEPAEDHDELLTNLVRGPLSTPHAAAGRLRGVRRSLWRRLGETLNKFEPDTEQALESIYQRPLTKYAEHKLRRSIRNGVSDDALAAQLTALHRDDNLVVAARTGNDPLRIVSSMGVRS